MIIATEESPVERIAQLIWIVGDSAVCKITLLFSTSMSFLLNQVPILENNCCFEGVLETVLTLEALEWKTVEAFLSHIFTILLALMCFLLPTWIMKESWSGLASSTVQGTTHS